MSSGHEGEVLESFVTKERDKAAALKFIMKGRLNPQGLADRDGRWVIENTGTAPDITVDTAPSDPPDVDPQLEAAVRACLDRLKSQPDLPARPPSPRARPAPGLSARGKRPRRFRAADPGVRRQSPHPPLT